MSSYVLTVFIHIAAAFLLLSTSIVGEPLVRAAARRAGTPQELRAFLSIGRPLGRLSPVAALLVLATGIYLASVGRFWALGWVQVAVGAWVINTFLAGVVVRRAVGRLEREVTTTTAAVMEPRLEELRWAPAWSWGQDIMATNDAVILALMTLKPSLGGSLLFILLAAVAALMTRQVVGLQGPPVVPVGGVTPGS